MAAFDILAVGFIMKLVGILFLICAIAVVLIILIQKGKGGGLSGALAGGMASGILGSKTGDFLTWVTIILVGVFLILAVVMAKFYKPTVTGSRQSVQTQAAPAGDSQQTGQAIPPSAEPGPQSGQDDDTGTAGD